MGYRYPKDRNVLFTHKILYINVFLLIISQNIILPEDMQRAMAAEAEAKREARAKVLAAEGEVRAAKMMSEAAEQFDKSPQAITLRYLQTLQSISNDGKSSTIICPVPMGLVDMFK